MKSMVVRLSRWMSVRSSVTAACTETSSAETGSSATTTCGAPAKARAMPMRCFWPPESWRGMRRAKARGSLHEVEELEHPRLALGVGACRRGISPARE